MALQGQVEGRRCGNQEVLLLSFMALASSDGKDCSYVVISYVKDAII
jgi:hypothetical protein